LKRLRGGRIIVVSNGSNRMLGLRPHPIGERSPR
jgi:hypothetical protein